MFRKTMIALAAVTFVGALAVSSTVDARGGFGGGGHFGGGGMRMGGGGSHVGHVGHVGGFGFRRIGGIGFHRPGIGLRRPPIIIGHHHPHFWRYGWRRHYWVAPVVATGIATGVVAAPTWNRCTCLTKEYTPEGAVVFKDLCTKEMAMNPPANLSPAAYDPSQDPSTQGSLQPQIQPR
jgi:hypothetical protein